MLCFFHVAFLLLTQDEFLILSTERSLASRVCLLIPKVNYRTVHLEKLFSWPPVCLLLTSEKVLYFRSELATESCIGQFAWIVKFAPRMFQKCSLSSLIFKKTEFYSKKKNCFVIILYATGDGNSLLTQHCIQNKQDHSQLFPMVKKIIFGSVALNSPTECHSEHIYIPDIYKAIGNPK